MSKTCVSTLLVLLLGLSGVVRGQLTPDSVYTIFTARGDINDVEAFEPLSNWYCWFVFVLAVDSGSQILWKQSVEWSDLSEAPMILRSTAGAVRHPYVIEKDTYDEGTHWRCHYFFWEEKNGGESAVMFAKYDLDRWQEASVFLPSPFGQSGLSLCTSRYSSDIGLAWVENDSVTFVRFSLDTVRARFRFRLTTKQNCRNPTVYDDDNRGIVVWEERDTASVLVCATINKEDTTISVCTLASNGDNIFPRFNNNPRSNAPLLVWAHRDSMAYNLCALDDVSPFGSPQPVTYDTIGMDYPGAIFIGPRITRSGLGRLQVGDVFAYRRAVGDSQAVVRSWTTSMGYQSDATWTHNEVSCVGITQGGYLSPLVFWAVKDSAMCSLKGIPTSFLLNSVETRETFPSGSILSQNYPNPFNPRTTIEFNLPHSDFVVLKIFDLLGNEVATLASGHFEAGSHVQQWNATGIPSGVYFCRLQAGSHVQTRKLMVLK